MPNSQDTTDSNSEALPSVIEYVTQSGVLIRITPLSVFTLQGVKRKSETLYPYPDKTAYQIPSEVSAMGFLPAEENPEYVEATEAIDRERTIWENDAYLELACEYPQYANREAMIEHFAPRLHQISKFMELSGDDWKDVLEHCVFTKSERTGTGIRNERLDVVLIATQQRYLALSMPEVMDGLRVFRLDVPGRGT